MSEIDNIKYNFLKELEENENRIIKGEQEVIPLAKDYNLNDEAYTMLIKQLKADGLIKADYAHADGKIRVMLSAQITTEGKTYLREMQH